ATDDPNGYVDPLGLLPAPSDSGADQTGSTASPPASAGAASAPPAGKPASSALRRPRAATTRRSSPESGRSQARAHEHERAQEPRPDARPTRSPHRLDVRAKEDAHPRASLGRVSDQTRSLRRHFVELPAHE